MDKIPLNILLGNIITFLAVGLIAAAGTRKTKTGILVFQELANACFIVSGLLLHAYSGVVQNVVAFLRNLTALYMPGNTVIGWGLVVCGVIFGIRFNNHGIIGLFPVFCSLPFAVLVLRKNKDPIPLKAAMVCTSFGYAVYAIVTSNLAGLITNSATAVITAASVYRMIKEKDSRAV